MFGAVQLVAGEVSYGKANPLHRFLMQRLRRRGIVYDVSYVVTTQRARHVLVYRKVLTAWRPAVSGKSFSSHHTLAYHHYGKRALSNQDLVVIAHLRLVLCLIGGYQCMELDTRFPASLS